MEEKYKEKYRTTPARLTEWDYGANGLYFVTICTKNRVRYFGEIEKYEIKGNEIQCIASLQSTVIGQIALDNWLRIPEFSPFVELDDFVIMPDHLHGILFINKPNKMNWEPNKFGVQSQNLASVIRGYKASVTKEANSKIIEFAWQPKYYDRIIRNEKEHLNIKQYIHDNPEQWLLGNEKYDESIF
ncbi:MAG: hypothetical protein V4592_20075 [Bacteroidota bacterium]